MDATHKYWRVDTGIGKDQLVSLLNQITDEGYKTEDRFFSIETNQWVVISFIER